MNMPPAPTPARPAAAAAPMVSALLATLLACNAPAAAQLSPPVVAQALALATDAAAALAPADARVLASAGVLDPRLRLAPCEQVTPYLPAASPPWGRTRIGLRCTQGPTPWHVQLPVTVQVLAPALVVASALPAGARIEPTQLSLAEVDWAAAATPPYTTEESLAGRVLARPVAAGQALRAADLKPRVWFEHGDTVRVSARGNGFSITVEGQALSPGREGQPARVRTESGRIVVGRPVGERLVEIGL
jgi:flagellar basal body P-ring formation protein FlgA